MAFARAKALKRFFRETWYMLPVSLILALIIEFLNHHTPEKLILFLSGHPWMFLFNVEIIFNTFLFAELFRRRRGARCGLRCDGGPQRGDGDGRRASGAGEASVRVPRAAAAAACYACARRLRLGGLLRLRCAMPALGSCAARPAGSGARGGK